MELKVKLKQEQNPKLRKQSLGRQPCLLRNLEKNKERLKEIGIWEDDVTSELEIKQEDEFQKQAAEDVQKWLKEGNVEL